MVKIKRTLIVTVAKVVKVDIENETFNYETIMIPGRLKAKEIEKRYNVVSVSSINYNKLHTAVDIEKYIALCEKDGIFFLEDLKEEK